jgi:hypothetical protein
MPVSELHRRVAAVALSAAAGHGFALGGGNALLAHGIISRETQDVDLFTDQERGVEAAAGAVEAALRDAGFMTERRDLAGGPTEVFPGMGEGLAEWIVTAPDGGQMMLQMAYFDRDRESPSPPTSARSSTFKTSRAARSARWRVASNPRTTRTPQPCSSTSVPRD